LDAYLVQQQYSTWLDISNHQKTRKTMSQFYEI